MQLGKDIVKKSLDRFRNTVTKEAKTALTKQSRNDTKKLYNSIDSNLIVSKNSIQIDFLMEDYGKFKDKGVKGKNSTSKAPNSPYRFGKSSGSKRKRGGLGDHIDALVKRKRIQFRDRKTGRFMSHKQTAYLIASSIYNKGIETTNFFTKPFESAFKNLPDELVESYGLEVDDLLKKALL